MGERHGGFDTSRAVHAQAFPCFVLKHRLILSLIMPNTTALRLRVSQDAVMNTA
jgi:hypothetical protein